MTKKPRALDLPPPPTDSGLSPKLLVSLIGSSLWLIAASAHAQAEGGGLAQTGGVRIQPRLSVSETLTDNVKLSESAKDAALVSVISPGISISQPIGRLRGSLDYALNGVLYTKSAEADRIQHALSANLSYEALENRFYIDGQASMSMQTISAFGVVSADQNLTNANRTQVASLSVSPHISGLIGTLASYQLRATATEARAKDSLAGDSSTQSASLQVSGLGSNVLNWSTSLTAQQSDPKSSRTTKNVSGTGSLSWRPDYEWGAGLTAGGERSNYTSTSDKNSAVYGVNANWTPTPRTKIAFDWTHHDYGNSHNYSFEHRMSRSVWRYVDTQSVSTAGAQGATGAQTNYDLLYALYASIQPDATLRDALVRSLLASLGLSADALATSGYLTGSSSQSRNQQLSLALESQRSTLTLLASRVQSRSLSSAAALAGDLASSSFVLQKGYSLTLAHRLTPMSSASLSVSQQNTAGELASQASRLRSVTTNWNGRFGKQSSVQLGLRASHFTSAARSYDEHAVLATFTQQF